MATIARIAIERENGHVSSKVFGQTLDLLGTQVIAYRKAAGVLIVDALTADAVIKAMKKGDAWLADRIYSGVPAGDFGLSQRIDVSHAMILVAMGGNLIRRNAHP